MGIKANSEPGCIITWCAAITAPLAVDYIPHIVQQDNFLVNVIFQKSHASKNPKFVALFIQNPVPGPSDNFINTLYCFYCQFSIVPKFEGKNNFTMYSFIN